ncbi:MAG: nuclear transport factor 2 family protein [Dokdonella sp.]|uniref:nuclear transport factor 2 family protein n=1 Tax=Dokdonella sp. TaxID=2291710 RepID=UPI0032636FC7
MCCRLLCGFFALFASMSIGVAAEKIPRYVSVHQTSPDDRRAIETVLSTYTRSVSTGDESAFEALLLDKDIPFSSTDELLGPGGDPAHVDTRRYERFRKSVFASGTHYAQTFHNVRIEQDGPLAQVSLDFVTRIRGTRKGGYGFKTLHLVKTHGQWKIASEFYTVHALRDPR